MTCTPGHQGGVHTASAQSGSGVLDQPRSTSVSFITPNLRPPSPCPRATWRGWAGTYSGSRGACSTCLTVFARKTLVGRERSNIMIHFSSSADCRPQDRAGALCSPEFLANPPPELHFPALPSHLLLSLSPSQHRSCLSLPAAVSHQSPGVDSQRAQSSTGSAMGIMLPTRGPRRMPRDAPSPQVSNTHPGVGSGEALTLRPGAPGSPFSPALPGSPWKREGRAMRWRALVGVGVWPAGETGVWGHCLMDSKG